MIYQRLVKLGVKIINFKYNRFVDMKISNLIVQFLHKEEVKSLKYEH